MALSKVIGKGVGNLDELGVGTASPSYKVHSVTTSGSDYAGFFHNSSGSGNGTALVVKGGANNTGAGTFIVQDYGGNTDLMVDGNGHVTMPNQSAFMARSGSNSSAYSINGWHTIAFVTERFDNNADFSSPNFTAPVTGRYQLNVNIRISDLDNDADYYQLKLVTSNFNYYFGLIDPGRWSGTLSYYSDAVSVLADMDASDTAYVQLYQGAGAQQAFTNDNDCHFSGYLVA